MPGRLNQVTIGGSREGTTVVIPCTSRNALLDRLSSEGDADDVIVAFRDAGTSVPVRLDPSAKRRLLEAVHAWEVELGNVDLFPEGIFDLRCALYAERDYGTLD